MENPCKVTYLPLGKMWNWLAFMALAEFKYWLRLPPNGKESSWLSI